jgi:hypothetical protein
MADMVVWLRRNAMTERVRENVVSREERAKKTVGAYYYTRRVICVIIIKKHSKNKKNKKFALSFTTISHYNRANREKQPINQI